MITGNNISHIDIDTVYNSGCRHEFTQIHRWMLMAV